MHDVVHGATIDNQEEHLVHIKQYIESIVVHVITILYLIIHKILRMESIVQGG